MFWWRWVPPPLPNLAPLPFRLWISLWGIYLDGGNSQGFLPNSSDLEWCTKSCRTHSVRGALCSHGLRVICLDSMDVLSRDWVSSGPNTPMCLDRSRHMSYHHRILCHIVGAHIQYFRCCQHTMGSGGCRLKWLSRFFYLEIVFEVPEIGENWSMKIDLVWIENCLYLGCS